MQEDWNDSLVQKQATTSNGRGMRLFAVVILIVATTALVGGLWWMIKPSTETASEVESPSTSATPTSGVKKVVWQSYESENYEWAFMHPPDFNTEEQSSGSVQTGYAWDDDSGASGVLVRFNQTSELFIENPDPATLGAKDLIAYTAGDFNGYELRELVDSPSQNYRMFYMNNGGTVLLIEVYIGSEEHPIAVSIYSQLTTAIVNSLKLKGTME